MSKKSIFIVLSVCMIVAMLGGCAPAATATPEPVAPAAAAPADTTVAATADTTAAQPAATTADTTAAGKKLKVFAAFATPIQEPWDGVVHTALLQAQKEGKIDYTFTENIGYAGDMERILREACDKEKPDVIFGDSFGNEEAVRRVAKDYPEIAFIFGSGAGPAEPNFSVFDDWIHEPAYLAGMLAAGMSKSGIVGIVAAQPIPEVNRIVNAFQEGAKEINPNVKTSIAYINSFYDPPTAKEAALAQIAQGADVLYAERFGVVDAAKEKGVYAIGMMGDQNELAPDLVLTSVDWSCTPLVDYIIKAVTNHSYVAMDYKDFSALSKGGSFLSPYHNTESKIPAELKAKIDAKAAAIKDGSFRVNINDAEPIPLK